ncbi:MAG: hypothetical protein K0R65_1005 [Crocinitomicaceae bacterium]|jgi:hypothetical protein|nr:hypothetical protein [Crocinitomicaceae bacterium]
MHKIEIKIAKDFVTTPGPRYKKEGSHSGELFRDTILYPKLKEAINENIILQVDLDGTAGYGTSFLEESFGGLIRENNLTIDVINKHLQIISSEEDYLCEDIQHYLEDAESKRKK